MRAIKLGTITISEDRLLDWLAAHTEGAQIIYDYVPTVKTSGKPVIRHFEKKAVVQEDDEF